MKEPVKLPRTYPALLLLKILCASLRGLGAENLGCHQRPLISESQYLDLIFILPTINILRIYSFFVWSLGYDEAARLTGGASPRHFERSCPPARTDSGNEVEARQQ